MEQMANHEQLLEQVLLELKVVRGPDRRGEYTAWCPFHPDGQGKPPHQPNLQVSVRGYVCHACDAKGGLVALARHLGTPEDSSPKRPVATYDYRDEEGGLLSQVVRLPGKRFRQRRPDGVGGWIWNLDGIRRVLYRLPELMARTDDTVCLCEGEKDCDQLMSVGFLATTNPGGAGKWSDEYCAFLKDRDVVILPDNDEPGRKHSVSVASAVFGQARSVKIMLLPGLPEKGDVTDWLDAGHTVDELLRLVESSPRWEPIAEDTGPKTSVEDCTPRIAVAQWPKPLRSEAFHGLAGEVVAVFEPYTEADPAALLISFLVVFGNVVGRGRHFVAEADRHYTNLFAVLVGASAKGRKGSSLGRIVELLRDLDPVWAGGRIQSGLSSGEGLIHAVRDPVEKQEPIREKGVVIEYQSIVVDDGVEDKRLLVIEPEFASTLRVMGRDGSTLSPVIRSAWDSGDLKVLTKTSPEKATGAHISVVGHITKNELLRYLDSTEAGNGFANRFLWICVRRARILPDGGSPPTEHLNRLKLELKDIVASAGQVGEMKRDCEARELWHQIYPELSEGKPGLLGAMTARAEAQVMRLALLYALLDRSETIGAGHLRAALAVWDYVEASARFTFGDALGDPVADELLRALRSAPAGLTRTDIANLFGRNKSAREIGRALAMLEGSGLAIVARDKRGEGRPVERWLANTPPCDSRRSPSYEINELDEKSPDQVPVSSFNSYNSYLTEPDNLEEGVI